MSSCFFQNPNAIHYDYFVAHDWVIGYFCRRILYLANNVAFENQQLLVKTFGDSFLQVFCSFFVLPEWTCQTPVKIFLMFVNAGDINDFALRLKSHLGRT